jgi:hypothetical protein
MRVQPVQFRRRPAMRRPVDARPNFRTVAHMIAAKPQKTGGYQRRRRFVVLKVVTFLKDV